MKLKKSTVKSLTFSTLAPLLFGVILLLNYLVGLFPLRLDLTAAKQFSLTAATKKTLSALDDIVNIKVFVSDNLPPNALIVKQEVKDILAEYQTLSQKKLRLSFIDPKDEETKREALNLGIPPLQFSHIQKEKLEVGQGFFGAAVLFADRKEVIPTIDGGNLEYEFTSAIRKVTREKTPKIAFSRGHKELDGQSEISLIRRLLRKEYEVSEVDFGREETVSPDIRTLIVAGPRAKFAEKDQHILDQFLTGGGNLLLLLDGVEVSGNLQTTKPAHNLFKFLKFYGLRLNQDLILDASNEIANFTSGSATFFTPYPFWPKILKEGFNQENPATSRLETAMFPWASTIEIDRSGLGGRTAVELVKSSQKSWVQSDRFNLSPQQRFDPKKAELRPRTVAAVLSGKFTSFFEGKKSGQEPPEEGKEAKLLLVADADFIRDNLLRRYQANAALFLNLVDYLSQGSDLFALRSKGLINRPLRDLSDDQRMTVKYLNIFAPPFLVVLLASAKFYLRNRRRYTLSS